jgi:hypothetical protein
MPEADESGAGGGAAATIRAALGLPKSVYRRVVPWLPAAFFLGGFVWDAMTLGRRIKPVDLFILFGYLAGATVILVALGRQVSFRGSLYLNAVLQFFFGGMFSALFIFYFLSSSGLGGYLVVLALAALLIGNEFLESRYGELTLSWTLYTVSAVMFFNFALAHLFRSISAFWFYLGTLIAMMLVVGLWRVARRGSASIVPSIGVAVLVLVLHVMNVIPPVPLVKKEMFVAHDVRKSEGAYVARVESPRWRVWSRSAKSFRRTGNERVYCFTSVFVPNGITTTIRHRWERWDEQRGAWSDAGVVPFRISGGREGGYRGYTYKSNVPPGEWRVIAESEAGAAIGIVTFDVVEGEPLHLRTIHL